MIITDTTLVGYTVINGSWQLHLGLLIGTYYNNYMYPDSQVIVDESVMPYLAQLREKLLILHSFLMVTNYIQFHEKIKNEGVKYSCTFFGMMFYQFIILTTGNVLFFMPRPKQCRNLATGCVVMWLQIELLAWAGILLSNVMFLFLRSLVKHKVLVDGFLDETKRLPQIDTIIATRQVGFSFHTEIVPFIISNYLYWDSKRNNISEPGLLGAQLTVILVSNYISVVFTIIMIFVSWKKGPKWYRRIAPYLFFAMLLTVYIFVPLLNIGYNVSTWVMPGVDNRSNFYESWVLLYFVFNIARILSFFTSIRRTFLSEAKTYNEIRILIQDLTPAQIKQLKHKTQNETVKDLSKGGSSIEKWRRELLAQIDSQTQERIPYRDQVRKYGEGEIRLGTTLEFDEDIYSFAFICQMNDKIMDNTIDVLTGKTKKEIEDEEIRDRELESLEKENLIKEKERRNKEFEKEAKRREKTGETPSNQALQRRFEAKKEELILKYELRVEEEEEKEEVVAVVETQEEKLQRLQVEKFRRAVKVVQTRRIKRLNATMLSILTFACQTVLIAEVLVQLIVFETEQLTTNINFSSVIFARFICATILHLSLTEEIYSGMERMKYACNHPYKFHSWQLAFLTAWCQSTVVTLVECCNIVVICVAFYPVAIVLNFIAIAVISEFDNYVYASMRNECMKKIIEEREINEEIFVKHHTTSKRCGLQELSDQKDEKGNFRPLKVTFGSRGCGNKMLYIVYKLYRIFFVSVYFYFMPFIVVLLSILLPLMSKTGNTAM